GGYRLPRTIGARLSAAVDGLRNADATMRLAQFLARFHTAPGRLGRAFPVDRIALAVHGELELTEARVRGALAALERIGFVVREAMPGSAYRATAEGLHRKPVFWRFAPEFFVLFEKANAAAKRDRGAGSPARRPITSSTAPRPHVSLPAAPKPAPLLAKRQTQAKAFSFGEMKPTEPNTSLEAALDRWRKALEGRAA
ncbi:hypothetical protein MKK55_26825, partial [Methylobacterium sp. J-059]|uniref:hypothetical protein n=1 Tax=Methylobacterium sp. J-059 TaxID=2836643 RepID=UPI001FBBE574